MKSKLFCVGMLILILAMFTGCYPSDAGFVTVEWGGEEIVDGETTFQLFSTIEVNATSGWLVFNVRNDTSSNVTIERIAVSGADASQFACDLSGLDKTLAADESSAFRMAFNPLNPGTKEGTVTITGKRGTTAEAFSFFVRGWGARAVTTIEQPYQHLIAGGIAAQKAFYVPQGYDGAYTYTCGPTSLYMLFKYHGGHELLPAEGYFRDSAGNEVDLHETIGPETALKLSSKMADWCDTNYYGTTWTNLKEAVTGLYYENGGALEHYYSDWNYQDTEYDNTGETAVIRDGIFQNGVRPFLETNNAVVFHVDGHYMVIVGYDAIGGIVYYVDPHKETWDPWMEQVSYSDFVSTEFYKGTKHWDGKFLCAGF